MVGYWRGRKEEVTVKVDDKNDLCPRKKTFKTIVFHKETEQTLL